MGLVFDWFGTGVLFVIPQQRGRPVGRVFDSFGTEVLLVIPQ